MRIKRSATSLMFVFLCVTIVGFSGCTALNTPVSNVTDIKSVDFSKNMRKAESCSYFLFNFIGPFGDASIVEAAKDSKFLKVDLVDYRDSWYLVVTQRCVVIYGQ